MEKQNSTCSRYFIGEKYIMISLGNNTLKQDPFNWETWVLTLLNVVVIFSSNLTRRLQLGNMGAYSTKHCQGQQMSINKSKRFPSK